MTTYLMEPRSETIYTMDELQANYERYLQDQYADSAEGTNSVIPFEKWTAGLVEVVPNRIEDPDYDPKCGDWRKA